MPTQEKITIRFEPVGDKKLIAAINALVKAQDALQKELKQTTEQNKKANKSFGLFNKQFSRNQKGATRLSAVFSSLRSKLLLLNFAFGMGIKQLVGFAKEAAKLQNVTKAFNTLAGASENSKIALNRLEDATDGTMSKMDLLTQANNAMILGVSKNSEEMAHMFDVAQRLGRALGRDTQSSVESLITGIGRQSRLMLDNIGIIVKADEAYKSFAREVGVSADKLTDQQKKLLLIKRLWKLQAKQ